ncbi:MAG: tetratricopeptide repeat protein [candidate division Zixibacteria bacterium]|nr:tetratricopeptide repeat protein [candidate division Zixibacteria bacterium]MBU1471724.1 tetratricopeptide repeat protein [candidate division Zixibacteria bacterium]MBU2625178.1 tetratricopeptide repeat protein [candidate division Zixibacteria bacterium]
MISNRDILKIAALCIVAAALASVGCSSGGGTEPPPPYDVDGNLASAWTKFTAKDYAGAETVFTDVINHAGDNAQAYMGRGWCRALETEFATAVTDFNDAIDKGLTTADAYMGLAAIYRDYPAGNPDYTAAIDYASEVLDIDTNYVFSRNVRFNYKDARLIKAQCYFRLGPDYFLLAHIEVNHLCDYYSHETDPLPSPDTFAPGDYEVALGEKIERLSDLIGR